MKGISQRVTASSSCDSVVGDDEIEDGKARGDLSNFAGQCSITFIYSILTLCVVSFCLSYLISQ